MRLIALALVVFALPLSAEAQPMGKVPRMGWLAAGATPVLDDAVRRGLRDLGYVEGKNIIMEYRAAEKLDRLPAVAAELREPVNLEQACALMRRARAEALVTINSPLILTHLRPIVDLAAKSRLPAMHWESRWVDAGGLMSYGPSYSDLWRRTATYVDKILKGARPSELPIEQPTQFELVVNLKTAKALGLTITPSLLRRAERLLE
jgi:putative ABC transport system substrate-binding protein